MTRGNINTIPYGQQPRRIGADKRGDSVWVPNNAASNLAKINIHTLDDAEAWTVGEFYATEASGFTGL